MIRLPTILSTEEGSTLPPTSNSSLLPTTLNPTVSRPTKLTPLGTLSILPRELRDQIYSIYLHAHGLSYHPYAWLDDRMWCGKSYQGLSIIRVSKSVYAEFLSVLCSEGILKIDHSVFSQKKQLNHLPVAKDICNVSVLLDMNLTYAENYSYKLPLPLYQALSGMSAEPVSFFTGTSKMRNACVLHFWMCTPRTQLVLQSPLMHAISELTAFNIVQLVFYPKEDCWTHGMKTAYKAFETFVFEISRSLEPTLKSFVWYINCDDHTRCSEFDPRKNSNRLGAGSGSQMDKIRTVHLRC